MLSRDDCSINSTLAFRSEQALRIYYQDIRGTCLSPIFGARIAADVGTRSLPERLDQEGGWTYLAALCAVVLMGIALSAVGQTWSVTMKREREAELFFRGLQIKSAIERYAGDYEVRKGTRENIYPLRLDQLVDGSKRYLSRVYRDPVTEEAFELIWEKGEIRGVRSTSTERLFNHVLFPAAATYQEIAFKAIASPSNAQ
jgi:type II secretory pathway pseudopilin PulG